MPKRRIISGIATASLESRVPAAKPLEHLHDKNSMTWYRDAPGVPVQLKESQSKVGTVADLGAFVRKVRSERKLSQQALADLAGVGRRFLSELEMGKETSEIGLVLRVTSALGIDLTARTR